VKQTQMQLAKFIESEYLTKSLVETDGNAV